jgi:hypothetical protein
MDECEEIQLEVRGHMRSTLAASWAEEILRIKSTARALVALQATFSGGVSHVPLVFWHHGQVGDHPMGRAAFALAVIALAACGGSTGRGAEMSTSLSNAPVPSSISSEATTVARCVANRQNCTPEQVIATVAQLYQVGGGATAAEAACLAPITGRGAHAVNQAFEPTSGAQTQAAIACVGSEARLRAISASLANWFTKHPDG